MKRPPLSILILLLLGVTFILAKQPLTKAVILGTLIVGIGAAIGRLLIGRPPVRRLVARSRGSALTFFVPALFVLAVVAAALATQPRLHATYTPAAFASTHDIDSQRGFFDTEVDAAGNRYVWTQDRATIVFNFHVHKPVTFTFMMRSAAVAGGPPDPVRVTVNGKDAGELRPDPKNAAFQPLTLRITPYDWGGEQTEVKLLPAIFKPQGDTRTLGTMVQSISVDKGETWSAVGRRIWLLWLLPFLGVAACGFSWITRAYRSPPAAYGRVAACLIGAACAAAILALVVRVGFIARDTYLVWTIGSAYLALCFAAGAVMVPIGDAPSPFRRLRARIAASHLIPRAATTIRATMRPPTDDPAPTRAILLRDLLLLFLIALGVRSIWAIVNPPWQAPDEPDHFIYIAHIVEQREIPHPPFSNYPLYPQEMATSWDLTLFGRISSLGVSVDHELPYLPISYDYDAARNYQAPDVERRSYSGARATVYPPLYYLYDAIPYALFKATPILSRLFAVRFGSAILGAASCAFGYLLAYEVRRTRRWGWALGLCMALLPMYAFTTATANNDVAMNLCATALIWLTVRLYRRAEFSPRLGLALGVTSGLALLAKPTVFPIVAVAGIAILVKLIPALRGSWQSARTKLLALGAYVAGAIAVYGPWALFRLHYYGDAGLGAIPLQPLIRSLTGGTAVAAASLPPAAGAAPPPLSASSLAAITLWRYLHIEWGRGRSYFRALLIRDFWGNFGWLDAPMPDRVFTPIIVVYLIGGVGVLTQLVLQPKRRGALLLLLGFVAAQALFLFIGADYYLGYVHTGKELGLQGRYFFPIIAPLFFLILSGWDHLCQENSLVLRFAPLGMAVVQLIGLSTLLMRYYGVAIG